MPCKLLSVVIPAYNEEQTIQAILKKVAEVQLVHGIQKEIIVVDDASTDKTAESIKCFAEANPEINIQFKRHNTNLGKGAALHTGIRLATGEYTVIQDADLEYDPNDYNDLLGPVVNVEADVVYGSRFISGKPHRILFFWHTFGNKFLTFLCNMFCNLNLTDLETCYKLFRTSILQQISLQEKRFGFEVEVTAKMARHRPIKIYEVGIAYYGRTYAEGKKINWKDGFGALYCILKYGLFRR